VEVRGRVAVRRRVAAADLPAGLAHAQVQPAAADLQALLAAGERLGQLRDLHHVQMRALNSHDAETIHESIGHDEVLRLLAEEAAQLVEVLPATSFEAEHIVGAINIPLKELDRRAPDELDRERPVIVYCNDYQ